MTKRPEAALWQQLKSKTAQRVDWDRLENSVAYGMTDLIGSVNYLVTYEPKCLDFYLELKFSPTKTLSRDLWKPTQVAWQTRAARRGRTVYNLVHRPLSSPIYWLYAGIDLLNLVTAEDPEAIVPVAKSNDLNELIDAIIADHRSKSKDHERRISSDGH
jgi:hypothetical protein